MRFVFQRISESSQFVGRISVSFHANVKMATRLSVDSQRGRLRNNRINRPRMGSASKGLIARGAPKLRLPVNRPIVHHGRSLPPSQNSIKQDSSRFADPGLFGVNLSAEALDQCSGRTIGQTEIRLEMRDCLAANQNSQASRRISSAKARVRAAICTPQEIAKGLSVPVREYPSSRAFRGGWARLKDGRRRSDLQSLL
jgi:hypothetical protein